MNEELFDDTVVAAAFQFLIGKCEQECNDGMLMLAINEFQFLIGKCEQKVNRTELVLQRVKFEEFQFLIGKCELR